MTEAHFVSLNLKKNHVKLMHCQVYARSFYIIEFAVFCKMEKKGACLGPKFMCATLTDMRKLSA